MRLVGTVDVAPGGNQGGHGAAVALRLSRGGIADVETLLRGGAACAAAASMGAGWGLGSRQVSPEMMQGGAFGQVEDGQERLGETRRFVGDDAPGSLRLSSPSAGRECRGKGREWRQMFSL